MYISVVQKVSENSDYKARTPFEWVFKCFEPSASFPRTFTLLDCQASARTKQQRNWNTVKYYHKIILPYVTKYCKVHLQLGSIRSRKDRAAIKVCNGFGRSWDWSDKSNYPTKGTMLSGRWLCEFNYFRVKETKHNSRHGIYVE